MNQSFDSFGSAGAEELTCTQDGAHVHTSVGTNTKYKLRALSGFCLFV